VAAFAKPDEQGQEGGTDVEPGGKAFHVHHGYSRRDAQHKPRRDGQHVHDDHVLQPEGVSDHHQQVPGDDQPEVEIEQKRQRQANGGDDHRRNNGYPRLQLTGGQGTLSFAGVLSVFLNVHQVVDQVDRAGDHA